jgi:Uncharacterised nucleotidyltransferase
VLTEAVAALREKNIEPVLFKGTALAYSLYPNPVWRSRGDTDMIVAPQDWGRASEALVALGFRRDTGVSGEFVSYQDSYTKEVDSGRHTIDLHRRINNSELLSRLFSYAELRAEACSLPELCDGALGAGPVHALLLACLHPATHKHNPYFVDGIAYYGGDRLIWLYDLDLLLQSFAQAQWQEFVDQATAKGLCAISLDAIDQAAACYGTRCPDFVRRALTKTGERVATYLTARICERLGVRLPRGRVDLTGVGVGAGLSRLGSRGGFERGVEKTYCRRRRQLRVRGSRDICLSR